MKIMSLNYIILREDVNSINTNNTSKKVRAESLKKFYYLSKVKVY